MKILIVLIYLICCTHSLFGGGKKAPPMRITFHLESTPEIGKKFTFQANTLLGTKYFKRFPEIHTSHIASFTSFPSPHNENEYGIILKLNSQGHKLLHQLSNQHQGAYLIAFLNGRPVDLLRVDRPVRDGLLCIWRGISATDIKLADTLVPRIGEDPKKWKKRLKKRRSK